LKYFEASLQVALEGELNLFAIAMENYIALARVRVASTLRANEPDQAKALFEAAVLFKQVTAKYLKFAAQYTTVYKEDFFNGNQDYASHAFHSGTAYCDMGHYPDAITQLLKAADLRIELNLQGQLKNRIAEVYKWLAKAYLGNNELVLAEQYSKQSLKIYQELPAPDQGGIQAVTDILSQITAAQASTAAVCQS
jgi:tetratricopeptide (TPR) repeat protein